jgi:RNA polymerase sigma factor (sigma-70 family)
LSGLEVIAVNPMSPVQIGHLHLPAGRDVREKHFASVYKHYYRQIYGICRRYSSRSDDARDMAHEVFVRYYQNFDRFRHEAAPSTWMFRVAVNLGIHKWKKETVRQRHDRELEAAPDPDPDHETLLLNRIALNKILSRYPERTRRILHLHHVERRTQMEISELLGISRATVTRHLDQVQHCKA